MPDLVGPITRVTLAFGLWLIPLAPALAAAFALLLPLWQKTQVTTPPIGQDKRVARASFAALLASLLAAAWHTLHLARLPAGERTLLEHVHRFVRIGQLDLSLDLVLDPTSATLVLALAAIALGLLVAAHESASAPALGWSSLLAAGAFVALLADGFGGMLLGWGTVSMAIFGLTREPGAYVRSRSADAVLMFGAAVLFWGQGGDFTDGEYVPDVTPRLAAVRIAGPAVMTSGEGELSPDEDDYIEPPPPEGTALLTMTAYPGARIVMDDAKRPLVRGGRPLASPFVRFPVPAGRHSFRVQPGNGLDDILVPHVRLDPKEETTILALGPSMTFAQMKDGLVVRDAAGDVSPRAALLSRKLAGVSIVTMALVLVFVGALARASLVPFQRTLVHVAASSTYAGALVATLACPLGVYLLIRFQGLLSLSGMARTLVAFTGALTALAGALLAARGSHVRRIAAGLAVSDLGVATMGAGAGLASTTALTLATSALGLGALWCAALAPSASGSAHASAPRGVVAAWGVASTATWLVSVPKWLLVCSALSKQGLVHVSGWLIVLVGAATAGIATYAAVRGQALLSRHRPASETSLGLEGGVPLFFALAAAALGLVVGFEHPSLRRAMPFGAHSWLFAPGATGDVPQFSARLLGWVGALSFGAAALGATVARRKPLPGEGAHLAEAAEVAHDTTFAAHAGTALLETAVLAALGLERWVFGALGAFASAGERAAGALVAGTDDAAERATVGRAAVYTARLPVSVVVSLAVGCVLVIVAIFSLVLRRAT